MAKIYSEKPELSWLIDDMMNLNLTVWQSYLDREKMWEVIRMCSQTANCLQDKEQQ